MIEVADLRKSYGRFDAVSGVSFTVGKGEILGFLGPNGAGKTTTMRILTGFMPATSGRVSVAGYDVFTSPLEAKRSVGYLPELPPVYPDLDVMSYLDFCARIKGIKAADRKTRIDRAIEKARLTEVRHKLIGRLSKGYRQRVGIAQAILADPPVLILDEPTAGLDPQQIIETRELIKSLGGDHTIILSTHILPEVSMTCNRVVIISKGRVVAEDTPQNLTTRLSGKGGVRLEVRADTRNAFDALRGVDGIVTVNPRGDAAGHTILELQAEEGKDIRAAAARAIVAANIDLLSLSQISLSLEDVFLELTTKDAALVAEVAPARLEVFSPIAPTLPLEVGAEDAPRSETPPLSQTEPKENH
jgi:ABC-2 type transport system ATP-binding protein